MSRSLTESEKALREKRLRNFESFLRDRAYVLTDFASRLELLEPDRITLDPWRYLPSVSEFMRRQTVMDDEDRVWIVARLGYFIGELLVKAFDGEWFVNDMSGSKYFLEYVVGHFRQPSQPNATVAPFLIARDFVRDQNGDLETLVNEVVMEIASGSVGLTH